MKLAFFHHTLRLGSGIDTVITELASRLTKKHEVSVYCFSTDYLKANYNFEVEVIKSPFTATTNRMYTLAPFLLDKIGNTLQGLEKYDVVNTHIFPANYIARNLKRPLKLVTEWTVGPSDLWSTSLKQRLYIKYLVYRGNKAAVRKADLVISSSNFISKWVEDNYHVSPTLLNLDGINFQLLDRNKATPHKVFLSYPELERKKIILYVGRITDHKNIHVLIDAFALLKQKMRDVVLILVGDYKNYMNYYMRLLKLVKNKRVEEEVIFTGVVPWDELPSYYSACSIYATCTSWEGFLRPESFAFGKPIVCFDTGPNSETVTNEKSGLLVKKVDSTLFAESMQRLLNNDLERQKMGEEGYRWARQYLDFDTITEKFGALCQNSCNRK
jgi:1,2-diacylglycerol 3-alpha-glucosyltransferase